VAAHPGLFFSEDHHNPARPVGKPLGHAPRRPFGLSTIIGLTCWRHAWLVSDSSSIRVAQQVPEMPRFIQHALFPGAETVPTFSKLKIADNFCHFG